MECEHKKEPSSMDLEICSKSNLSSTRTSLWTNGQASKQASKGGGGARQKHNFPFSCLFNLVVSMSNWFGSFFLSIFDDALQPSLYISGALFYVTTRGREYVVQIDFCRWLFMGEKFVWINCRHKNILCMYVNKREN